MRLKEIIKIIREEFSKHFFSFKIINDWFNLINKFTDKVAEDFNKFRKEKKDNKRFGGI